jgi:hypothetical protein
VGRFRLPLRPRAELQAQDVGGHAGSGPGAAASLIIPLSTGQPSVALANRLVPIEPVNARLVLPVA